MSNRDLADFEQIGFNLDLDKHTAESAGGVFRISQDLSGANLGTQRINETPNDKRSHIDDDDDYVNEEEDILVSTTSEK